jgi:hypothetical protein
MQFTFSLLSTIMGTLGSRVGVDDIIREKDRSRRLCRIRMTIRDRHSRGPSVTGVLEAVAACFLGRLLAE